MISQISLFTEDSGLEVDENSNKLSKPDKRSVASEAVVSKSISLNALKNKTKTATSMILSS